MDEFFKFVAPGLPDKSEKGGPGSGHHGHAGRPGLRGGSAPEKGGAGGGGGDESRGEDNLAYQEMVKGLDLTKGFTVSLHGVSKKAGKSVSPFPQHGITIDPDDFNRENVYKWIDKVKPVMLKDERIHYGGWENSDDGLFYLDLSILVRSRSEAAEICRKHNQIAFYDLDTGLN